MRLDNIKKDGYLTVYLALTLSVLLSLCLALIEGVRSNGIRLEAACVTDIGLNSIFAEYHRELSEQYNLFAIDSSYGSGHAARQNVMCHLQEYLKRNLTMEDVFLSDFLYRDFLAMSVEDVEMTKALILTDKDGSVFRRRAVEAIKDDVGLAILEELQQWMQVVKANELDTRDVESEKQAVDQEIERLLEFVDEEEVDETIENPTNRVEEVRREGILKWVIEDTESLSERVIDTDSLIMERMAQGKVTQGNIEIEEISTVQEMAERFLFQEYLLQYMEHYEQQNEENTASTKDENNALCYQVEYLIAGEPGDIDNLKSVANRLCLFREAANTVYILSDQTKCMEAEAVATVLSALVQLPELMGPLKLAILLGWAYAESLYDVETLLAGGRVPLMKDEDTWHYSLHGALQVADKGKGEESEGLSYEDYLRIFMALTDLDTLTGRAMNMVEADIRQTAGNGNFRLDGCYDQLEVCIRIESAYGYNYSITRQMGY